MHSMAVTQLASTATSRDRTRTDHQQNDYERHLKTYQDKVHRHRCTIAKFISRTRRLSQKIDLLVAENQNKDQLIAQLLAEEDDDSSSEEEMMEGACALVELCRDQ